MINMYKYLSTDADCDVLIFANSQDAAEDVVAELLQVQYEGDIESAKEAYSVAEVVIVISDVSDGSAMALSEIQKIGE